MSGPQNNNTLEAAMVLASISDIPSPSLKSLPAKNYNISNSSIIGSNQALKNTMTNKHNEGRFFPKIMMEIIADPSNSNIVSWLPQGFAFMIKDSKKLNCEILPRLRMGKRTIESHLNQWGFKMISRGQKSSVYFHQYFHRDSPRLCERMKVMSLLDSKSSNAILEHKSKQTKVEIKNQTTFRELPQMKKYPQTTEMSNTTSDGSNTGNEPLRTVSPSNDVQSIQPVLQGNKPGSKHSNTDEKKLLEQKKMILTYFYQRRRANNESLHLLAKQFKPGSKLAEFNKSIHSFREHHNLVISKSIDALLYPKSK